MIPMNDRNKELLTEFRKRIPFLNEIPDEIYFNLDPSEFYLPDEEVNRVRMELENKLNNYVMTYQDGVLHLNISLEEHLCAHIKPAKLSKKQLKILETLENIVKGKGIGFVIYQKPLVIIKPQKSDIHKLLQKQLK